MIRSVPRLRVVLALGVVSCAGGCGGSAHAPTSTAATVVDATCQSSAGAGTAVSQSCTFVLGDGERFSCGQPFKGPSPTAAQLERSGCRRLASLKLSGSELALIARLNGARSCLTAKGLHARRRDGYLECGPDEAASRFGRGMSGLAGEWKQA